MKTDPDLNRRLALASYELRRQLPPATLLASIHRRLDTPARRSRALRPAWLAWAGVSTAAVAISALLVANSLLPLAEQPATTTDADGFVRLVTDSEWQQAKSGSGQTWVIDADVSQARLAALGLPYDPARAGERVPAQLLMHSSGEVLAVRFTR